MIICHLYSGNFSEICINYLNRLNEAKRDRRNFTCYDIVWC